MSKKILSLFMALSIFMASNFAAQKSEAVVGLLVKKKVVTIIGGIGMGTGGTMAVVSLVGHATSTATGWAAFGSALGAAITFSFGILIGGIGLIILDDKTVADLEFVQLNKQIAPKADEYDIAVYNSELDELNAIRKSIQAELNDQDDVKKANALWLQYRDALSPQTIALAEAQAAHFIKVTSR